MFKEEHSQLIADVMDCFDFRKVHTAMRLLEWTWSSSSKKDCDDIGVPFEWTLRKEARRLLTNAIEGALKHKTEWYIATGGFKATFDYETDTLALCFILEDWEETLGND